MARAKHNSPNRRPIQQNQPQQQNGIISQQWSGPLPPPAALAQFNQIIPNGAERIIAMVEQEQAHRIQYENKVLDATIIDTKRGHWLGSLISLSAIGGAIFSVYIGAHPAVSIALVSVPVVAMVQAIIKSKTGRD